MSASDVWRMSSRPGNQMMKQGFSSMAIETKGVDCEGQRFTYMT